MMKNKTDRDKMNEEWLRLCKDHQINIYYEEKKKRWCMYGNGLTIANCLRATRAKRIKIGEEIYEMAEATHQIYQLAEIKFAFSELIF